MTTTQPDHAQIIADHLDATLVGLDQPAPAYRGKVRDVYERDNELLLVATDRLSAFDVVLGTVPFKGALLTEQACFWLEKAAAVIPTHFLERVDAQAMRCRKARALPVEVVVRGYLAGSLLREPPQHRGRDYGVRIDPDLPDFARLPAPIVTPTTKEAVGTHDRPCSPADLVREGRVERRHLDRAIDAALALFQMGSDFARQQGLLLVDTKYEFGLVDDDVILIDEVHTADSSRFWLATSYEQRLQHGMAPEMLDKERVRRWLLSQGFQGHGPPPALSSEVRIDLAVHYWQLTERVLGRPFQPPVGDPTTRLRAVVSSFGSGGAAGS